MKIEYIEHKNVNKDGTFSDGKKGAVITTGQLIVSRKKMHISIIHPLKKGVVRVSKITFSSDEEADQYIGLL